MKSALTHSASHPRKGNTQVRIGIALLIGLVSLISYCATSDVNQVTGEKQRVALDEEEEIALGLKAKPEMVQQHKGMHPSVLAQQRIDRIGDELLAALKKDLEKEGRKNPYPFEFHLLKDDQTINAFALPGGQVFITAALYNRLETDGRIAGVLGHEIGHVLSRHGAQRLAKQNLTQGLTGAAGVASGDPDAARMAQVVGALVNMQYGREDELEADRWGVKLMSLAGYDPRGLIGVMQVLDEASKGNRQPEFLSSHPKPANRIIYIEKLIDEVYPPPKGVPDGLKQ